LVSAKLAVESFVLALHARLRVDEHQASDSADDDLVSRLDGLHCFGDPVAAGVPIERAKIELCENLPPRSVTKPRTWL